MMNMNCVWKVVLLFQRKHLNNCINMPIRKIASIFMYQTMLEKDLLKRMMDFERDNDVDLGDDPGTQTR